MPQPSTGFTYKPDQSTVKKDAVDATNARCVLLAHRHNNATLPTIRDTSLYLAARHCPMNTQHMPRCAPAAPHLLPSLSLRACSARLLCSCNAAAAISLQHGALFHRPA